MSYKSENPLSPDKITKTQMRTVAKTIAFRGELDFEDYQEQTKRIAWELYCLFNIGDGFSVDADLAAEITRMARFHQGRIKRFLNI